MASGDTILILTPLDNTPPATVYATLDTTTGASAPVESVPVLDFDDTTAEYADFYCMMPRNYAAGGLTFAFIWTAATTSGTAVLRAAFRRVANNGTDLDTDVFSYDYNSTGALTPPTTIGKATYSALTFTSGSDSDSVVAGDYFILRVGRNPADGNDTMTGDLSLAAIEIKET